MPITTYYGNPDNSDVHANVNLLSGLVEHRAGNWTIRNRTMLGNYDRGYQNYVPGAVTADKSQVALTAYNNATDRRNLFNQTDARLRRHDGAIHHTLLAGAEIGQQLTDNFRNTGYFNNLVTSILVPYGEPDDHDAGDVPSEADGRRQSSAHQPRRVATCRIRSS